jgi:hypothetical protein
VRTFQVGKYSALSQRLLNELSAARVCLLDPAKKAAYDDQLRTWTICRSAALEITSASDSKSPTPNKR